MIDRDTSSLLRAEADLPDLLREALETAAGDKLPGPARMNRIEVKLAAAIARDDENPAGAPNARISGWRPAAPQRHIRFAAAKVGLAALVGMGAAWSSVEGYRVYQEAVLRTSTERAPERPAIEPRIKSAKPRAASEAPNREPSLSGVADPDPILAVPPAVAEAAATPPLSTKPSSVPRIDPPVPPPNVAIAPPPPLEEDLLERATQALHRDPTEALALADEHARTFGTGRLAQEREVIAIQALSKLGRFDAARARAQRFLNQYSNSPYANDVARLANAAGSR